MFDRLFMLALTASLTAIPMVADADTALVERGAYIARISDCAGCHMPRAADGSPMFEAGMSGGNIGFELPGIGIFWPPNLTASSAGLGDWSDDEILAALQTGIRPDGRVLVPVMPWPAYADLSEDDAASLVAYLRSLPAVETPTPAPVASAAEATAPFYRVTMPSN